MKIGWQEGQRKFNIPFNFSNELIVGIQILKIFISQINCLYIAPYIEDYFATVTEVENIDDSSLHNKDRDYYFEIINQLNKQFPNKLQLVLDDNLSKNYQTMSGNLLEEYILAGFKKFRVGTINQAKIIKEIIPEAEITGAITMHTNKENIEQNMTEYLKYFKDFILDFSYNRDIESIKLLPKEFKYCLTLDLMCDIRCPGDFHWFWGFKDRQLDPFPAECPYFQFGNYSFENSTYIRPMDLSLFDNYIDNYDLGLRNWKSEKILRDLILYTTNYETFMPNLNINENLYKKNEQKY